VKLIIDIDIVNYNVCRIGGEDFGPVQQAVGKGIPLEDIKAEIKAYKNSVDKAISEDELKREGMKLAYQDSIDIIDRHIGGEENEE